MQMNIEMQIKKFRGIRERLEVSVLFSAVFILYQNTD